MCNGQEQIVEILAGSAQVHDTAFHCVLKNVEDEMIVLADSGFKAKKGNPINLKICKRGKWNERMLIEIVNSFFTTVLKLKESPTESGARSTPDSVMSPPLLTFVRPGRQKSRSDLPISPFDSN
jgi:hypothetical protein